MMNRVNGVVEGTPILTPRGFVPVERIKPGDEVLSACGGIHLAAATVGKARVNDYAGAVRRLITAGGNAVTVTPNKTVFGRLHIYAPQGVEDEEQCTDNGAIFEMFPPDDEGKWQRYGLRPNFSVYAVANAEVHVRMSFTDCENAWEHAKGLQTRQDNGRITVYASTGKALNFALPASAVTEWHWLPVFLKAEKQRFTDGRITSRPIHALTDEHYTGRMYDLCVNPLRNYLAAGIVVFGACEHEGVDVVNEL